MVLGFPLITLTCSHLLYSFDFIFCFSEINPYFFYNKKSNTGNFIGREIKVSHIKFAGPYEANRKKNKSMLGMWLVKLPGKKFSNMKEIPNLPGMVCFLLADNSKKICAFVNGVVTSSFCVF